MAIEPVSNIDVADRLRIARLDAERTRVEQAQAAQAQATDEANRLQQESLLAQQQLEQVQAQADLVQLQQQQQTQQTDLAKVQDQQVQDTRLQDQRLDDQKAQIRAQDQVKEQTQLLQAERTRIDGEQAYRAQSTPTSNDDLETRALASGFQPVTEQAVDPGGIDRLDLSAAAQAATAGVSEFDQLTRE
jgi:hypothetical protein